MNIVVVPVLLSFDRKDAGQFVIVLDGKSDPKAIGQWLRGMRESKGITVEGLAAWLGCHEETVEELERGDGRPAAWMVALDLEALGYELVVSAIRLTA